MIETFEENGSFVDLMGSPVVFIHDINTLPNFSKIISQVDGIEKYERALAIARPEDVIITKNYPEESYLKWLRKVGLGSQRIIVLNGNTHESLPERILRVDIQKQLEFLLGSRKSDAVLSPYYGGELEKRVSWHLDLEMYANTDIVKKFDSKVNFKNLCRRIGIPVIEDIIFIRRSSKHDKEQLTKLINENINETGKVIVRGEYGASASSTYIMNNSNISRTCDIVNNSKLGDRFLVEPYYDALSNPSSVWFVTKDQRVVHLKTSNQILDEETSHIGNEFPVTFDEALVQKLSFKIAKNFLKEGFIGPFGIDFVETKNGIFAAECNPRVTGAMYPWELVHHVEIDETIKAARAQNIHLTQNSISFKDLIRIWDNVLYDGHNGNGMIIPYNVGPISEGKVTVLATGSSRKDIEQLFEDIKLGLDQLR